MLPFYLKHIGADGYGLIGLWGIIQAFALLLDSGMTPMLTREVAQTKEKEGSALYLKNMLRTTEILLLIVAILFCLMVFFFSTIIADKWLNNSNLPKDIVKTSIVLIGIIVATRFNTSLYGATVMALERQICYNVASSAIATIKSFGAMYVLLQVSNSVIFFLKFQILISFLEFILYRLLVAWFMPRTKSRAVFSLNIYRGKLHFIGGYSISALFVFLLLQSGGIILSKILSLSDFGYYTFALTLVSVLQMMGTPILQAISPRLINIYANDKKNISSFYHFSCQLMAFLTIPAGLTLCFYSYEIIFIWTRNMETANQVYAIVSLLSIGTLLNLLVTMPGQLQIANGKTKVMVYTNALSLAFVLPLDIIFGIMYGGIGVAFVWILLNIFYIFVSIFFVHSRLLDEEKTRWILNDVIRPMIIQILFFLLSKFFYNILDIQSMVFKIFFILFVLIFGYCISIYSLNLIRLETIKYVKNIFK